MFEGRRELLSLDTAVHVCFSHMNCLSVSVFSGQSVLFSLLVHAYLFFQCCEHVLSVWIVVFGFFVCFLFCYCMLCKVMLCSIDVYSDRDG